MHFFYAKLHIKFLYSSSSNNSIDNIANSINLSYDIVDFRYDFINFNIEKLLSVEATIIGILYKLYMHLEKNLTLFFFFNN